jgi:hypothetical protein
VVSVNIEVSIFNGGLEISVIIFFMLLANFFLGKFKFVLIEDAIANGVSEELDGLVNITLEYLESEV